MLHSKKRILFIGSATNGLSPAGLPQDSFEVTFVDARGDLLRSVSQYAPDLLIFDMTPDFQVSLQGMKLLRDHENPVPFVARVSSGCVSAAVAAMKMGAREVLECHSAADVLSAAVCEVFSAPTQTDMRRVQPRPLRPPLMGDFGAMAGGSQGMRELFSKIQQIAERDTTVLITGESGTGKELVAREIHLRSPRADAPFVALNCAAIPETLIESELFGHEKGAFTHAVERRLGQVELANGGTLFLDEIGELSLAVQVKLLRFLQEQEFYRVGKSKPISVDIRVITATNRDLDESVAQKTFRQDLLYRINVINLHIPALRDRADDIPRLVEHCVAKLSPRYSGKRLSFSAEALACLSSYPWPGNVRELENVLEGILALCASSEVAETDLPPKIRDQRAGLEGFQASRLHTSGIAFGEAERMFETEIIVRALEKSGYVQTRAAQLLGITRRILKYKMDKLGISDKGEVGVATGSKTNRAN